MNEIVSIIMPVYNAQEKLSRSISAVLDQSYSNFELILVDDGSTDNSIDICNSFLKSDSRIRVYQQTNHGPASAKNSGIKIANGVFMTFIDADDYIEKDFISVLVNEILKDKIDIVISSYSKIYNSNDTIVQEYKEVDDCVFDKGLPEKYFYDLYIQGVINPNWNKLYKTSIILKSKILFREDMRLGEDLFFNLDYLSKINGCASTSNIIINYDCLSDNTLSKIVDGNYQRTQMNIHNALIKFAENVYPGQDLIISLLKQHFFKGTIGYIQEIISNNNISILDKKNMIKKSIINTNTKSKIVGVRCENWKQKLMLLGINHNQFLFLVILTSLKKSRE